ncbi:Apyrase [Ancylostoma duodenale]|uniref:Apyrase n=1 Tax=Ancylostoma duodenale TaxID=51022 RepID=A0A0C2G3W5_9BILA|nr:Apyrase [Ancylostoma duodenale]
MKVVLSFFFFFEEKSLDGRSEQLCPSCNSSRPYVPRSLQDGSLVYDLLVVTDLARYSKVSDTKWQSIVRRGVLRMSADQRTFSVQWNAGSNVSLTTNISAGGRAMEQSDLAVFDGRVLAPDDRTGLIYEILNDVAYPWVFVSDGPGNTKKGLKIERLTVKADKLYAGGIGTEWRTKKGVYLNDNPMWVKIISRSGEVKHVNWRSVFVKIRRAVGIQYPGYVTHEAVQWSDFHHKWFFLPRRESHDVYDEVQDESRGTNLLITAAETFSSFQVVKIGKLVHPTRGFSAFQFIPNTEDNLIIALKSEEIHEKPVESYVSVFDIKGNILLPDSPLNTPLKFEGIAFV